MSDLGQILTGGAALPGTNLPALLRLGGGTALIILAMARAERMWAYVDEVEEDFEILVNAGLRLPRATVEEWPGSTTLWSLFRP